MQSFRLIFSRKLIRPEFLRYFFSSQQIFLAALLVHILFLVIFIWLGVSELAWFNVLSIGVFALALYLNYSGRHVIALWTTYVEVNAHAILTVFFIGWSSGFFYYLLVVGAMLFYNPHYRMAIKILPALLSIFILSLLFLADMQPVYSLGHEILSLLYMGNMICTFILLAYMSHYYAEGADRSEAQLRQLTSKYEELAIRDPLTGLLNRRAIAHELDAELNRFKRTGQEFTLVIGDIDNFKNYNDDYGHLGGDEVIKHVANILLNHSRSSDIVSRWGGEEFLLIMPGCSVEHAVHSVNNLRELIEASVINYNQHKIHITMTFGICAIVNGVSADECIEAADQALYHGKNSGKNRVEVARQNDAGKYVVVENTRNATEQS